LTSGPAYLIYIKIEALKENIKNQIFTTFAKLLKQQKFVAKELDYSILEKHKPLLLQLATLNNSGISIFDLYKNEHVFYSPNFCTLLGYRLNEILEKGQGYLDEKIHPVDYIELNKNGISLIKLYYHFSNDEKMNYKLLNEYRILNSDNKYIRVIEQHQPLELDIFGNIWLTLSMIDISPNQDIKEGLKSQLLDFRTGKIISFQNENLKNNKEIKISLTQREIQILQMVKNGLLSKEISDNLFISVHTVNTHRQRVLEKLGANNSMEAIVFASKLGLL
jgi:DNA-binding CsgD family transcriptional regulator